MFFDFLSAFNNESQGISLSVDKKKYPFNDFLVSILYVSMTIY